MKMKTGKRADRVGSHLCREIAMILQHKVNDPRVKEVTITGARCSDDLSTARIFFVINEANLEQPAKKRNLREVQKGLERASGFIKNELGQNLQLRRVPDLTFVPDESFGTGMRIDQLLKGLEKE